MVGDVASSSARTWSVSRPATLLSSPWTSSAASVSAMITERYFPHGSPGPGPDLDQDLQCIVGVVDHS